MERSVYVAAFGEFVHWSIAVLFARVRSPHEKREVSVHAGLEVFPVSAARNITVHNFLKTDREWLLMLDYDMNVPENLLEILDLPGAEDKDVISGRCLRFGADESGIRNGTVLPCWTPLTNRETPPWVELQKSGAGCLFVRRNVFERVECPWFDIRLNPCGLLEEAEDLFFCRKAREAGFRIWGLDDEHYEVGHVKKVDLLAARKFRFVEAEPFIHYARNCAKDI